MFNIEVFNSAQFNEESSTASPTLLLSIEKDITFSANTDTELLLSIEKTISASSDSETILGIEKRITDSSTFSPSFYERFGWEPIVLLDNLEVGADELCGEINITKVINDNHTASFSLILKPDVYNLYSFQGASVKIFYRNATGVYLRFTGIVDIPSIDVIFERLTLKCIADRRVLLTNLGGGFASYVGYYSPEVLTTSTDVYSIINDRLTTIPADLDFDSNNLPTVTSWQPKATPDFTFGPGTVYRREPTITLQSSGKVVNSVTLTLEYGFQRLHHRELNYVWNHTYAPASPNTGRGGICPFLIDRPTMPTREAIRSAAAGTGWALKESSFYFGKQFLSGNYQCSGVWVQWSTVQSGYLNAGVVDSNGNPVNDDNGNQLTRSVQTIVEDNTDRFTMNASWNASIRFNQNIKETYTLKIQAPSSIALYGELESSENYSYADDEQYANWAEYTTWQPPPTGAILKPASLGTSYAIDAAPNRFIFSNAFITALNKARTTILASHRDNVITFQCPIKPTIELKHTCKLTGKWIKGSGKCTSIKETFIVATQDGKHSGEAYNEIEISNFRSTYTITSDPLGVLSAPIDNYIPGQLPIYLQTHLAIDPNSPGAENWTGYVGNKAIVERITSYNSIFPTTNFTRSKFQESFIVNAPAITDLTQDKTLPLSAVYNVNIPTDDITYESYRGKGRYS